LAPLFILGHQYRHRRQLVDYTDDLFARLCAALSQWPVARRHELAVVQSRFFEVSWGIVGRFLFLIVAAAFLSDTWLATVDAVSRIHTDCLFGFFPKSQSISVRSWYLIFLFLLTAITGATMGAAAPGPLILISAVIGFVGTVLFSVALIFLNHVYLPPRLPAAARPGKLNLYCLIVSGIAYFVLAAMYL
jgi:hypothetical protein